MENQNTPAEDKGFKPRFTRFVRRFIILITAGFVVYWGSAAYIDNKQAQELGVSVSDLESLREKHSGIKAAKSWSFGDKQDVFLAANDFADTVLAIKEKNPNFPQKIEGPAEARYIQRTEAKVKALCVVKDSESCVQAKTEYASAIERGVDFTGMQGYVRAIFGAPLLFLVAVWFSFYLFDIVHIVKYLIREHSLQTAWFVVSVAMIFVCSLGIASHINKKQEGELGISVADLNSIQESKEFGIIDWFSKANHRPMAESVPFAAQNFADRILAIKAQNPDFPKTTNGTVFARAMQKAEEKVKVSCADVDSDSCVQAKVEYANAVLRAVEF